MTFKELTKVCALDTHLLISAFEKGATTLMYSGYLKTLFEMKLVFACFSDLKVRHLHVNDLNDLCVLLED